MLSWIPTSLFPVPSQATWAAFPPMPLPSSLASAASGTTGLVMTPHTFPRDSGELSVPSWGGRRGKVT